MAGQLPAEAVLAGCRVRFGDLTYENIILHARLDEADRELAAKDERIAELERLLGEATAPASSPSAE